MYTYNKDDKSYVFSSDELDIEDLVDMNENNESETKNTNEKPPKIEVINGGNDLNISPVSNHLEIERPKSEKKENIVIPEEKKD